jgi:hypothetical protein
VKLLLLPSQVQSALKSLDAEEGVAGEVYFFDTPTLELFSQGIIVRIRRGATTDLTVKLRPSADKEIHSASGHNAKFKCELDLTGDTAVRSYSIQTKLNAAPPESGKEVFALLNSAQKDLLDQAHTLIDWSQVKRIAEIKSTTWPIYNQLGFTKLVLELWEWPTGSVFELSTKVPLHAAPTAYAFLQRLASTKGLSRNSEQAPKTALALEQITHVTAH